jgi:hypothetical protein
MLRWNNPTAELTTAATDALLGFLCIFLIAGIHRYRAQALGKVRLWTWVFGLLSAASFLGAIAHGFDLSPALRNVLWQPLYLALGIDVSLFVLGGVYDWRGAQAASRLPPAAVVAGVGFYSLTLVLDGSFLVFVIYEGVAMVSALAIYVRLSVRQRLPGAASIAVAIGMSILAAALQASTLQLTLIWPFNHNGIFHLVQIVALLVLGCGLRTSMETRRGCSHSWP